jgi:protein TonB
MAKENGIQGKVFVQFVVWKDGTIKDVKVVKGVHKTLDSEALRVITRMPLWSPGKQRGKNVNARFTLPIKFRIS